MANTKISALTADTAPTADDLVVTVNDPGGTPATRKATITNLTKAIPAVIGDSGSGGTKGLVPAAAAGDAAANKFLHADGTYKTAAGSGAIGGSSGATDNAVIRADGAGGSTVQSSAVTIDDNGAVTVPEIAAPSTPGANKVVLYAKSDGLLYSKDDVGAETLVSGGSAGASNLDGLSDVTITSPSTDQVVKYNGSAWVNATAPAGSPPFIAGALDQYRIVAGVTRIGVSNTDSYGGATLNGYGDSAASADDADGVFRRYDTAASNTTTAGTSFNNSVLTRTAWLPQIIIKLKTHTSIAVCNIWAGLLSSTPGADDPAQHGASFRYSTTASDTNWKAWTNDGSGGGTITDTGVAVATSTLYNFKIIVESTSSIKFYISTDNGVTYNLVATHTTNLPTSSQGMDCYVQVQTLEGVAKSIKHSFTHLLMR